MFPHVLQTPGKQVGTTEYIFQRICLLAVHWLVIQAHVTTIGEGGGGQGGRKDVEEQQCG